jgi:hypothetical protein
MPFLLPASFKSYKVLIDNCYILVLARLFLFSSRGCVLVDFRVKRLESMNSLENYGNYCVSAYLIAISCMR